MILLVNSYLNKYDFVSLLTHPGNKNKGLIDSMRLAIASVETPWVAFLESDDFSKAGSVERLLKKIRGEEGVIFCNIEPVGLKNNDSNWFESYVPRICKKMLELQADVQPVSLDFLILTENLIPTFSCAAVKTDLLKEANFNSPVPEWIDWFLWIQICQKTKVSFIADKLVFWRQHSDSLNRKKIFFNTSENITCSGEKYEDCQVRRTILIKNLNNPCENF